jgi:hypothetical protein
MSIAYPLAIPAALGEAKANLKQFDAIGEVISPFSGQAQQQQWQDQHWELDLEFPEMTWAQFAAFEAFTGALHGKLGSFLWGPPLATAPRGIALTAGTPIATMVNLTIVSMIRTAGVVTCECFPPVGGAGFPVGQRVLVNWSDTTFNGTFVLTFSGIILTGLGPTFQFSWAQPGPNVATEDSPALGGTYSGTLTSLMNYAGAGQLSTSAWLPNKIGIFLPGDFFQLTVPDSTGTPRNRLYQYVGQSPASSDGGGNAVLDIFPALREAPAGVPLVLTNPQGEFRLADNRREAAAQSTKTFMLQLKCREAI